MKKLGLLILFLFAVTTISFSQISLINTSAYTQDFNTLASSGTSSTMPSGWIFSESGTNANTTYTAGTGAGNGGDTYSFGTLATDRAIGGLRSGNLIPLFGAGFTNNTGSRITALTIAFTGEQWRLGTTGRTDRVDFQYSLNATSLTTGAWSEQNQLDFSSPITTGTIGALDGNAVANRTAISFTMTGLNILNGSTIWIRWSDFDASGADDGLSIDDFSLTPTLANIVTSVSTLTNFQYPEGSGPSTSFSYDLSGSGLSPQDGNLTINGSTNYEVSTDNTSFNSSVNIAYTLGTLSATPVYVRLKAGLTQGLYNGEQIVNSGGGANNIIVTCDGEVGAPLPVELTSFSATTIGKDVKLSWNTATEINNYGFEVLRQAQDDKVWDKIGFVNGNGNSNSPKNYSFVDDKVNAGKYSYRLKQIDNDGQFEYSKTIEVDMNGVKKYELTQNYPNPFNPTTTISYILPQTGMVRLTLYNILGQEIRTLVNEVKEAGTHTFNFDASDLNSGMYIYKIESGSFTQTKKMTLVK